MEIAVILIVLVILVLSFVSFYNKLVKLKEQVISSEKEISTSLDRRGKIFDSLTAIVKKAMDYEKSTLKNVIELRNKIVNLKGSNPEETKKLEQELSTLISSGAFSSSFNMTMEAYPDLKANSNMMQFQEEVVSTENKLSYAKQGFNASIEEYNATKQSIPYNFIISIFPKLDKEFLYWELTESKIKEEEEKRVSFD